jgi:hypothetical protein
LASAGAAAFGAKRYMESQDVADEKATSPSLTLSDSLLLVEAKRLEDCIRQMASYVTGSFKLDEKLIQGIDGKDEDCVPAKAVQRELISIQRNVKAEKSKGGDATLVANLIRIIEKAKELCTQFLESSEKGDNGQSKELAEKQVKLNEKIKELTVLLDARNKTPAIHKQGPGMLAKMKNMVGGGKKSLVDSHLQSAHIKLEVTREQMKSAEEQADQALERQLDINRNRFYESDSANTFSDKLFKIVEFKTQFEPKNSRKNYLTI